MFLLIVEVITNASDEYATAFGFKKKKFFNALNDMEKEKVKKYDDFTFGNLTDIYNPWSIASFDDTLAAAYRQFVEACITVA